MDSDISAEIDLFMGGIVGFLFLAILANVISIQRPKSQKRIITTVAVANGLILELGLSPMGTLSSELVTLSPFFTVEFGNFVRSSVAVATVFEIVFGLSKMWEGSGWLGVLSFGFAFVGGVLLPYQEIAIGGIFLIGLAYPIMELSPTSHWMSRR